MKAVSPLINTNIGSHLLTSFGGYRTHLILNFLKDLELVTRRTIEVTRDQIIFKIESRYSDENKNFKR